MSLLETKTHQRKKLVAEVIDQKLLNLLQRAPPVLYLSWYKLDLKDNARILLLCEAFLALFLKPISVTFA